MDTPQTITHVSLCAGYGGIDLGLKRAIPDLRTIAFSEIEGYACANLVAKMEAGLLDTAPIWTNLKTFPWSEFRGKVDILSGGYPCQPFSAAGKRLGTEDPRHLWPFIADGIRLMQPRLCFFENVEGHVSLGLRAVIEELGNMGYQVSWGIFSASEVGAPHQRKRVFILAHLIDERLQGRVCGRTHQEWKDFNGYAGCGGAGGRIWPSRPGQPQYEWEPSRVVGDTESQRPTTQRAKHEGLSGELCATSASSENIIGDRQIKPSLGGDADGSTSRMDYAELSVTCDNRTDELRLLGNGVVPATATRAFLTLVEELNESPSLPTSSS
jgi:DNA (cytosine-5)-methyltransferase 1